MADTVTDQNEILEMNSCADDAAGTVTVIRAADDRQMAGEDSVNEEYILQQAFDESSFSASDAGQTIQIHYATEGGMELQNGDIIDTPDGPVQFISNGSLVPPEDVQTDENYNNNGYQVVADGAVEESNLYADQNSEVAQQRIDEPLDNSLDAIPGSTVVKNSINVENGTQNKVMQTQPQPKAPIGAPEIKTVLAASSVTDGAPLGSSQNPIRIIQQGNQYIPVQQLSTDQLQQIMQVVQQQQLTKQSTDLGSSVLFNPQTNTRIVYRVIYPSELHKDSEDSRSKDQEKSGQQTVQVHQKRQYKKRQKEEEEEKLEAPEMSKEEKEARKKMRPKTRSGRVSKPPKHMVKDFKHIHLLDYDEDYDDSDGGYSDFKQSDHEEDDESSRSSSKRDDDGNYLMPGIASLKPKKWKCSSCAKAYIGRAGLARHLSLNPDHGTLEPGPEDLAVTPTDPEADTSNDTMNTSITPTSGTMNGVNATVNGINSAASLSEDSRDSSSSISYTPRPRGGGLRGRPPWKGRGRGRGRGSRGAYSIDPELRRKNKLRDVVRDSTDEELMEIVLPRLTQVITLWEFLLMKVEKGNPARPHADDIYKEYIKLHDHVRRLCQEYLEIIPKAEAPQTDGNAPHTDSNVLRVEESAAAQSLGLTTGPYRVKEISDDDATFDYKLITTNKSVYNDYNNKSFLKRTVEVVSPQQLISPSKKLKTVEDVKSKIMPVSLSEKLKTLVPSSSNSVQNVSRPAQSVPLGKIIVVSQPGKLVPQSSPLMVSQASQPAVLVNSVSEGVETKPGIVYLSANDLKHQQALPVIAGQATPNNVQLVSAINHTDVVGTNTPVQKQAQMIPTMGTTTNSLLKPTVGTPVPVLNKPVKNPASLLKPSSVTPASQKFVIMSGTSNADIKSLNLSEVHQTNRRPKDVVLEPGSHLSSPFVNAASQAQQSFISSQTSSNIMVQTPGSNMSTLLPSNFIPPVGSSGGVSLLNGRVSVKGNSQQPVTYIAVPISQPSQPQISVPSFSSPLPGTIVLPPVVNSNSSSLPPGTTNITNLMSAVASSAYDPAQQSNVMKILNSRANSHQTIYQVVAEPPSSSVNSVNSGTMHTVTTEPLSANSDSLSSESNHMVDTGVINIDSQNDIINGSGVLVNSQDIEHSEGLHLSSQTEQNGQILDPSSHQSSVAEMTTDDTNIDENNVDSEQMEQSSTILDASLVTSSETLGVINSVDTSGTHLPNSDINISELVNNEDRIQVDDSEAVLMETAPDNNDQEETIQIPATNIFQTEDGLIFIQNPDGTTLQLQGSDGQSIPLETIQALLSMDGETQLITEQSEETQLITEQSGVM